MKRFIITLIIFSFIVALSIGSCNYIKASAERIDERLEYTIGLAKEDSENTVKEVNSIYDDWNKTEPIISMFIDKNYCESITAELSSAVFNIGRSKEEAIRNLHNGRIILKEILKSQVLSLDEII